MFKRKQCLFSGAILLSSIFSFLILFHQNADAATIGQNHAIDIAYQIVTENDDAVLSVNPQNLAIQIRNKQTDFIWGSTVDQIEEKRLNQTWQKFANSAITIDYVTANNQMRRESLEDGAKIDFISLENGFQANITFRSRIQLSMTVTLTKDQVHVSIPDDTISEPKSAQLMKATIYPFLGAQEGATSDGYIMLPDGPGVLLDYQDNAAKMTSPYQAPIYGVDPAIEHLQQPDNILPINTVTMPVYGVVHGINQNGLFTEIISGETYGTIIAYKAGLATDFHWVTTEFNYRYSYRQPTTSGDTTGLQMIQTTRNKMDIVLSYTLLSDDQANYVGMAQSYQRSLLDQGIFTAQSTNTSRLALTFFGGASKSGLLFDRYLSMTTFSEMDEIISDLKEEGINQLSVSYTGWQAPGSSAKDLTFARKLGSFADLDAYSGNGHPSENMFGMHIGYETDNQKPVGIEANHFAQQINGQLVTVDSQNQAHHILSANGLFQKVERDLTELKKLPLVYLSLSGIGQHLSSDFTKGKESTRIESQVMQLETLKQLTDAGFSLALAQPNVYLWSEMTQYVDLPLSSSGYTFVSQTVPFLPLVLDGYVDYTSPDMHLSSNQEINLLKSIEYGATPSFLLTAKDPSLLKDTSYTHLYSTKYTQQKENILHYGRQMDQIISAVGSNKIIAHEIIHLDLVRVTYSNGCIIYFNYGRSDEWVNDILVEKQSFLIIQEEEI